MDLAPCDLDTAFAEVIYGDAQWLREEFDALIAASFGQPPAAPPPAPPRVPPRRRPPLCRSPLTVGLRRDTVGSAHLRPDLSSPGGCRPLACQPTLTPFVPT